MKRGACVVLAYHRVARPERDPQLLCVTPERFEAQLACAARVAEIVPLSQVFEPSRDHRIAITFDDGYQDNLSAAEPMLASRGALATVFVTAGMVGAAREFWWDRLEQMMWSRHGPPFLDVRVAGASVRVDIRNTAGRERAYWTLHARLRRLAPSVIEGVLEDLVVKLGIEPKLRASHRVVNLEELRELSASDAIEVGSHTVSHPYLSSLSSDERVQQVRESKRRLEQMTGRAIRSFSYPFGEEEAVDVASVDAVKAAGYEVACANVPGRVTRRTDRFRVPRYLVRDWALTEFERHLSTWCDVAL